MKKILIALIAFALAAASCTKYDEGGFSNLADSRLLAQWELVAYLQDGTDMTEQIAVTNYMEEFYSGGTYYRAYDDKDGEAQNQAGSWEWSDDKTTLFMTGLSGISYLTPELPRVATPSLRIIRLKASEFWYRFESEGHVHEFHLEAK